MYCMAEWWLSSPFYRLYHGDFITQDAFTEQTDSSAGGLSEDTWVFLCSTRAWLSIHWGWRCNRWWSRQQYQTPCPSCSPIHWQCWSHHQLWCITPEPTLQCKTLPWTTYIWNRWVQSVVHTVCSPFLCNSIDLIMLTEAAHYVHMIVLNISYSMACKNTTPSTFKHYWMITEKSSTSMSAMRNWRDMGHWHLVTMLLVHLCRLNCVVG